jgi:F-type H+-transporting ATPase subunit b
MFQDPTAWVAISFVIFVVAAFVFGRKTVIDGLDAKIDGIRKDIATAEALRDQAQALLAEYQMKQAAASQEAGKIIDQAKTQADQLRKNAEEDFEVTMARKEAMLKERVLRMEESAMDDIRRYAAELAINATTQIIAQKMDAAGAEKLADASIRKVADNLN